MNNMHHYRISLLIFLIICLLIGCGSSRKLATNPQRLGIVPFSTARMAGEPDSLNKLLLEYIEDSGSFYLNILDTIAGYWNLETMKAARDSTSQWILTGKIISEIQSQEKGKKVPFLFYTPNSTYSIRLKYRLYNREKESWADIGEINVKKKQSGDIQFLEYDEADPSLALDAGERQRLRRQAYQQAVRHLIQKLESQINIK